MLVSMSLFIMFFCKDKLLELLNAAQITERIIVEMFYQTA